MTDSARREHLDALRRWCTWLAGAWDAVPVPSVPDALRRDVLAAAGLEGHVDAVAKASTARTRLATNLALVGRVAAAGEVLERAGLRWVAIKGAAMVTSHPQLMAARAMADVDLLVLADQFAEAVAALVAAGCTLVVEPGTKSATLRDEGGTLIDLHARLGAGRAEALVMGAPERIRGVWVPDELGRLVAASVHRARGNFSGDLREVFDIWLEVSAVSAQGHESVRAAADALVVSGVGAIVLLAGIEARDWFDVRCEEPMLLSALRRRVDDRRIAAVGALAAVRRGRGSLPWSGAPIVGRALTLSVLSQEPGAVWAEAGHLALVRARDVLTRGDAAGGRAGQWLGAGSSARRR